MFQKFAERIEELEKQIKEINKERAKQMCFWESKSKKEDKWKKCMESWLLKNFDFDIQDDLSKLSDNDEPEEERKSDSYSQAYEEPVISSYNNFQLAFIKKQVYNNPHLIIESPPFNSSEENNGLQKQQGRTRSQHDREDEYQSQQVTGLIPEPAHSNSQPRSHGILKLSYDNKCRSNIVNTKEQLRPEHLHKRKSASLMAERKSSSSPSSCTTPVSLQKIDEYSSNKLRLSHSRGHIGSNITLTPLPLTSSSTVNSDPGGFGHSGENSSPSRNNNTSTNYLSNNLSKIGHNVTSLTNTSSAHPLKEEDNEQEEWQEEDECALPHYNTGQLEIRRQNINHEESSEGRNSITSMSEEQDIEEISNDMEDHHNTDNLNLNHIPGVLSSGDINMFKGGTNFFSNPKNLPICSFCGKSYSSQTYLKTHIDVVHKGMKAFRCGSCGATFGFKSDLTRHVRSHLKRKTSVV